MNYDTGSAGPLFQGAAYSSGNGAFQTLWLGTTYSSLSATNGWSTRTTQEMLNGQLVGLAGMDPGRRQGFAFSES